MLPENLKAPSRAASFTDLAALRKAKKGKVKDGVEDVSQSTPAHNPWFLDVASPTSEDMRAIGKLLHLHPLTLEDILQQDPREKLELFPKLGYYFISFRSIESRTIRAKFERQIDPFIDTFGDEGLLVESNVYLVVFNEGVCSFHFMDASEHIDRVRKRIISLEKTISMSSAWIAHSLLDSIVDSFFPFTDEIEKEVMAIEELVYSDKMTTLPDAPRNTETISSDLEKEHSSVLSEKNLLKLEDNFRPRTRFALPRPPLPLLYKHFLRSIRYRWRSSSPEKPRPSSTMITLRRLARTRRLVTSLTRLLATKSEVVTQIRKRLLTGSGDGKVSSSDELEVAIYMGDVQDHILTLQHALAHSERMLSQFYPTYLQQLRASVSLTKNGADKALVYLTTLSIAVLCLQTVIAVFSLNVTVPASPESFHVFGIVVAVECVVLSAYLKLVRYWWVKAKKRRGKVLG
ncbi:hypothetical protein GYMLUDRAFT_148650 [Collybiopsis luxurians FD-317 M1]|nr:hypothetical protein GYMLUDRAFT_148650 [Collybiopsis luxurians FD-317 M1]